MDADIFPQESKTDGLRELPVVDGIPNSQVESWFQEIDTKAKGYITPAEALLFFRRTSLPKETLSKVLPMHFHQLLHRQTLLQGAEEDF